MWPRSTDLRLRREKCACFARHLNSPYLFLTYDSRLCRTLGRISAVVYLNPVYSHAPRPGLPHDSSFWFRVVTEAGQAAGAYGIDFSRSTVTVPFGCSLSV
jgi:hypothetical protein